MNTTGIPVWQNGSGSSADSYTENVENQIRKVDGKLKKGQRNNSGTNLSLKMSVLWRNCKCRKETFYGGTSLIIIIGVVLETLKQIESQMLVRNYTGFLNVKGKSMKNSFLGY